MNKIRLEAFSDGVFAIVITLLILNIKLPEVKYSGLADGLIQLLPDIGTYVLSFLLIGMYWVFHHHSFTLIKEIDGVMIWMNIIFLLFISFFPFPTMLMGKYPSQTLPILIYLLNLLLANSCGFIMVVYVGRNMNLAAASLTPQVYKQQMRTYLIVNGLYLICMILAFLVPSITMIIIGVLSVFLIYRTVVLMGIGRCKVSETE